MLSTFGIMSRLYRTKGAEAEGSFTYTNKSGETKSYGHSASYDLRISSESILRFAQHIGFSLSRKATLLPRHRGRFAEGSYAARMTAHLLERTNDGVELTYNLSEPRNHSYVVDGVVVRNCSEYVHLDDSACNLASMNLLTFLDENDEFDVEGFKAGVAVVFTGQEIIVGNADYPTERIGETTRAFRQLGIGYANLGALLMAQGLPYDSDAGRAWAAAITALLTGHAYATSAKTAARMGPFAGYHENAEPMLNVLRMHQAEAARIDEDVVPPELLSAAQESWDRAVDLAEAYGVRNSQASVLAPTGTIGLLMDCDTTGVEPDLGLVKTKKLVGGGTMSIVNQTVPRALAKLGYGLEQSEDIVALHQREHVDPRRPAHRARAPARLRLLHGRQHHPLLGPHPHDGGGAALHQRRHLQDGEHARGRDASRTSSSCTSTPGGSALRPWPSTGTTARWPSRCRRPRRRPPRWAATRRRPARTPRPTTGRCGPHRRARGGAAHEQQRVSSSVVVGAVRERLPRKRNSETFSFRVADCEGYVTVGEYEDGRPGEVFVKVSKQGSTLAGIMDAFSISISLGLQHGVPLATFVRKFANMKFEPAGITDDPELRIATSLIDYIFRRMALDFLSVEERSDLGILSTQERTQPTLPGVEEMATPSVGLVDDGLSSGRVGAEPASQALARAEQLDAPLCYSCGNTMQRAGSCYVCGSCGSTSGCS